ncbi:MAG TPA: hypothetical protein VN946_08595 [Terriglobales bacterium]|nr:hypothetical protein [Terriglobales bacterium]
MRKTFLYFELTMVEVVVSSFLFLVGAGCLAQPLPQPKSKQDNSLEIFLRDYLRDPFKTTRYFSAFVDLKGDGTRQVIVYFTDQHSCGSGGCTTLILAPTASSYQVVASITVVWPPIRILETKSNGWHDIGVMVHGGGIVKPYEAKLSFNGTTYPSNPTVAPAHRLTKKIAGEIVVPLDAQGVPLYP